jgi:hypothetical protein
MEDREKAHVHPDEQRPLGQLHGFIRTKLDLVLAEPFPPEWNDVLRKLNPQSDQPASRRKYQRS